MVRRQPDYAQALRAAERFLERWPDRFTVGVREDLAQEAVVESWKRESALKDEDRFDAYVRTVARRLRYHALKRLRRPSGVRVEAAPCDALVAPEPPSEPTLPVAGELVEVGWLCGRLDAALRCLAPVNRRLLREFYAGATLEELADRHGLTVARVKARLHRGRRRLRRELDAHVRRARHEDSDSVDGRPRP